jgi:(R,R)-butanediol dehydrogenase / meso-butanediol dehydrogenase / diacetyl reductase
MSYNFRKENDKIMKSAVFDGTPGLKIMDSPVPKIDSGEALIRVKYVGVCGSDIFICSGKNPRINPPLIPGHEVVGEIAEIDDQKQRFQVGDRVAIFPPLSCGECDFCKRGLDYLCNSLKILGCQTDGGFAEYVKAPIKNLVKIPDNLSFKEAVLVEPLAVTVHAVRLVRIEVGDHAAVIGAGPIGILTAQVLRLSGCPEVIISDLRKERLQIAKELDFKIVHSEANDGIDQFLRICPNGANLIFECVGHPSTIKQIMGIGKAKSQIVIVGMFKELAQIDFFKLSKKEQPIVASFLYTIDDFKRALELLKLKKINTSYVVSHILPLDKADEAFDLVKQAGNSMKIILEVG